MLFSGQFELCRGLAQPSAVEARQCASPPDRTIPELFSSTMRYLTPVSLKMPNSSSKSEFIASAGAAPMCIDRHLPRRVEDRLRTQALPVLDVERAVHPGNAPVPFHHEYRPRLFRSSVYR